MIRLFSRNDRAPAKHRHDYDKALEVAMFDPDHEPKHRLESAPKSEAAA